MLLIVGAHFYRSADYIRAARELGLGLSVGTDAAARWTHSDAVRAVDFTHFDGAVRDLTAFATDRGVTSVLGVDEVTVELAAGVAAELGVKSNPLSALRRTHRKDAFRDALRGCEYSVSSFRAFGLNESVLPTELFDQYPCVAKPTAMSASRGVIRVDEASALGPVLERLRALVARERSYFEQRILVEPFVDGPEFALEGMLTTGRLNVLALFDKPDVSEGPYFAESIYVTPSQLPHVRQRACAACVEAAAAKLGLVDGPVHAELRWSRQGPVLLEMAARGIGGLCGRIFSMARPYSLEEVHIRQAVGLPPPTLPSEVPAAGVLMLSVPKEGQVRAIEGVEAAKRIPNVLDVQLAVQAGDYVTTLPEAGMYVGFAFASGANPARVSAALASVRATVHLDIDVLRPASSDRSTTTRDHSPTYRQGLHR